MATRTRRSSSKAPARDIAQEVTDKIIAALEAGTAPWRKPWTSGMPPRNISGHIYSGINVLLTTMAGYESPFWMTFNQAKKGGGTVRKGEKGTMIVFWSTITVKDDKAENGEKKVFLLKHDTVFNVEQTEGVNLPKKVQEWTPEPVVFSHEAAEQIVAGYVDGPEVKHIDAGRAVYYPGADRIEVPPMSAYENGEEFYSTLFHEMGHSTGHASRLNRKTLVEHTGFGSHGYGREELVAEMTAAFLCAEAGIESTMDNSAAYLASWIATIKEDKRAVVVAARAASNAANRVLGRTAAEAATDAEGEVSPAAEDFERAA